jgi:hypothetical protein
MYPAEIRAIEWLAYQSSEQVEENMMLNRKRAHTTMPLNCMCGHIGNQSGSENTPEWKVSHSVLIKFMFMYPQGSVEYLYGIFLLDN